MYGCMHGVSWWIPLLCTIHANEKEIKNKNIKCGIAIKWNSANKKEWNTDILQHGQTSKNHTNCKITYLLHDTIRDHIIYEKIHIKGHNGWISGDRK
jgi:hypothetical protein